MPEETTENLKENIEQTPSRLPETSGGDFFSPAAVIMFLTAIVIDTAGFLIMCCGFDDLGILDIIGLIFVGGLMYLHSGQITPTKGVKKISKKLFKRLGLSFLGEIIPYFGSLAPCWTIAVYFHLKGS